MRKPDADRFIYSAYAHSIGVALDKPLKTFLTDAPSVALPVTGGFMAQAKETTHFHIDSAHIVSAGRTSASVLGERRDDHYVSMATATVEKLNILDMITADRIVVKVTSVYPVDKRDQGVSHPASFDISGSHFDNLRIDGTYKDCAMPAKETPGPFSASNIEGGVEPIFGKDHCGIHIPQFGIIHLGERFMYAGKVILSMLRVELGCPYSGKVSCSSGCTNGTNGL